MLFLLLKCLSYILFLFLWVSQTSAADLQQIELGNGTKVIGTITERFDDELSVKVENGPVISIKIANVVAISSLTTASEGKTLRLSGSTTIGGELAPDLAAAFLKSQVSSPGDPSVEVEQVRDPATPEKMTMTLSGHPDALYQAVEIDMTGSSDGIEALLSGETDFAMASRPIKEEEWQQFQNDDGVDMRSFDAEYVIGIDAIELIVSPQNRLSALSRNAIGDIYQKKITSWSDFQVRSSGLDTAIENLGREGGSGTGDTFERIVMGDASPSYDLVFGTASDLAVAVSQSPSAIGYVGIGNNGGNTVLAVDECGMDYHYDRFLVSSEDHPLARRLYLYRNPASTDLYQTAFTDFVLSAQKGAGQSIVDRHFVALNLREADDDITAWRLAMTGNQPTQRPEIRNQYRSTIEKARRLSSTFRFGVGGIGLDSRGERDLRSLIKKVTAENIDPNRLFIFGFADSLGDPNVNIEVSRSRANAIADRLRQTGLNVPEQNVIGIGEEVPIACNNRPDGSRDLQGSGRNRRIEVWLRYDDNEARTGIGGQLDPVTPARARVVRDDDTVNEAPPPGEGTSSPPSAGNAAPRPPMM